MSSVRPKKNLGQHFLKDESIAERIAKTSLDVEEYGSLPILEVGPGTGVLTQYLEVSKRELKVVELDPEAADYMERVYPGVSLVRGDFLNLDLRDMFGGREFILTGNYPYNISSQIFFKMLENKELIPLCTGMVQREVGQRLCAGPGSKTYGILSVLLGVWYDREYLFTVDENVFNPPPKVKSGVIRLKRNTRSELPCSESMLKAVVKQAFGQRRKTMRNSLASLISRLPEGNSTPSLQPYLGLRPEQVGIEDFIQLATILEV
jgi:16S rRNA (adenine1518-N6/adenine1519-N6)-dimethyltransferase